MNKVVIFGFSGGGKSTLAVKLGDILDIQPTHIDRLHWLPGWVEDTVPNKKAKLKPILERERWIIDGNYRSLYWNERLKMADTVIFIDTNRFSSLYHAWRRSRKYKGTTRPDMGDGCIEKFDFEFVKWILHDGRKKRKRDLELMKKLADEGKRAYIFRSFKDINNFLKGLK